MQRKPNHTCRVCGAAYYACAQCDRQKNWRAYCDTPEHYQVFQVLLMYSRHMMDAVEAASMLKNLGVNPDTIDGYTPQKVEEIRAIFAAAKPVEEVVEPVSEENCETDVPKTKTKSRRSDA